MKIPQTKKAPVKLPGGRKIQSNDPLDELRVNRKSREKALYEAADKRATFMDRDRRYDDHLYRLNSMDDAERADRLGLNSAELGEFDREVECLRTSFLLVDQWEIDARCLMEGILDHGARAERMGVSIEEFDAIQSAVKELEKTTWKKQADFFADMLASDIFKQTAFLRRGDLYSRGKVYTAQDIQSRQRMSRSTYYRRKKNHTSAKDLLRRPRSKLPNEELLHDGRRYTPIGFGKAFGISLARVRSGIRSGFSAAEILATPAPARGRPRGSKPMASKA